MSLDSVLTQAAASVPECLAAGYVLIAERKEKKQDD